MIPDVQKLAVLYNDDPVGTLQMAPDGKYCVFEYEQSWLLNGFSLSPKELPLLPGLLYADPDRFGGSFAVFEDCLPDGYGLYLLERMLNRQGSSLRDLTPLQKLSIIGNAGMGALSFLPFFKLGSQTEIRTTNLDLLQEKALEVRDVKSFWCGNPLIDDFAHYQPSSAWEYDPLRIALLPGSRRSEIRSLLPVLEEAALALREKGYKPVFSIAPGLDEASKGLIEKNASGIESTLISGRDLMFYSRMVIGASGTAAVESMLLDRFMIVLYRGTPVEWRIYKLLTHTDFVSIPNVLAGKIVFPELLQDDANGANVLHAAWRYLEDEKYNKSVHEQLLNNRQMMGSPGAVQRWAAAIAQLVRS